MRNLTIRLETPDDYRETESLTRKAFWNLYKPGCDEHLVLHKMRTIPAFVHDLAFVATDDATIVGNVVATEARIISAEGDEITVLCLGPIAVLPAHQGSGIGARLMNHVIERARGLGYRAVLLFGNPDYYTRFGFRNAEVYGIQTSTGENFDAFMALELTDGGLAGVHGRFHADPVFEVDADELDTFERQFPPKEKRVTDTQLT